MPKYLGLITGVGEGCDYTIACNKSWKIQTANNKEEFVHSILEYHGQTYFDSSYPEPRIKSIQIFELKEESITFDNLDEWYFQQCKEFKQEKKESEERRLYEELKSKFEK